MRNYRVESLEANAPNVLPLSTAITINANAMKLVHPVYVSDGKCPFILNIAPSTFGVEELAFRTPRLVRRSSVVRSRESIVASERDESGDKERRCGARESTRERYTCGIFIRFAGRGAKHGAVPPLCDSHRSARADSRDCVRLPRHVRAYPRECAAHV